MTSDDVNNFLNKNRELFQDLQVLNTLEKHGASSKELEIAHWVRLHKEGLAEKIALFHNPAHDLLPDALYFLYLDNYENNAVDAIKSEAAQSLQLNPEECLLINTKFVRIVLGKEILTPPK